MDNQKPATSSQPSRQEYREQLSRQQSAHHHETGEEVTGRRQYADQEKMKTAAEKTAVLKRKLNIAIVGLVVAIVIVYLILFYVG